MNLYEAIARADSHRKVICATVLTGPHTGEAALLSEDRVIWPGHYAGFLGVCADRICTFHSSGIRLLGDTSVFCEILGSRQDLVICGAGHVSMSLIRLGKMLQMHVTCIDDRPEFAENARQAGADTVICAPFSSTLQGLSSGPDTLFVVVTRGHRYDLDCLLEIFQKDYAYVGMMGSRSRTALVKESLSAQGIREERIADLHAPIGLPIGAQTPEQIAISVMAQIIDLTSRSGRAPAYPPELLSAILRRDGHRRVLATIISKRGSAPRSVGTKMLIDEDGSCTLTIGGGCVEMYIAAQALELLRERDKSQRIIDVDISPETAADEGMVCGGHIRVLLQLLCL